jgi:hypothetical protein
MGGAVVTRRGRCAESEDREVLGGVVVIERGRCGGTIMPVYRRVRGT